MHAGIAGPWAGDASAVQPNAPVFPESARGQGKRQIPQNCLQVLYVTVADYLSK